MIVISPMDEVAWRKPIFIAKPYKLDKLTAISLSFDKILITYVIPGFCASFPWLIFVLHFHKETQDYLVQNNSVCITLVTFLSLVTGLIIENFGSWIEVFWFDKKNRKIDAEFSECWKKYLQLCYKEEPIGQRYIRNILLRMKFELSMGIAAIVFVIGLYFVESIKVSLFASWISRIISYGLPILLSIYFICWEAKKSSSVLATTRKYLVDKYYSSIAQGNP